MSVFMQERSKQHQHLDVRIKAVAITLAVAGITFPLTFAVWPPMMPVGAPAPAKVLSLGLLVAECLAMGGGVAFLILGYPAMKRLPVSTPLAFASYLGIGFCLVNWWTHDHLHYVADMLSFTGWLWMTVALEYVFHAGMMVFAAVLALLFAKIVLAGSATQSASPAAEAAEGVAAC